MPAVLLYRFLSAVGLALYAPYALLLSLTGRRRLGDLKGRLGRVSYPDLEGGIWIHAVSVGEVAIARAILRELSTLAGKKRLGLSVTTAAGRALAEKTCAGTADVFAYPFDLEGPVERALSSVRPGLILLTETELWPLFLTRARERGIPVALVNGRLSDRSFPRYRRARRFLSSALSGVGLFLMQSREDADRMAALNHRAADKGRYRGSTGVSPRRPERGRLYRWRRCVAAGLGFGQLPANGMVSARSPSQ